MSVTSKASFRDFGIFLLDPRYSIKSYSKPSAGRFIRYLVLGSGPFPILLYITRNPLPWSFSAHSLFAVKAIEIRAGDFGEKSRTWKYALGVVCSLTTDTELSLVRSFPSMTP